MIIYLDGPINAGKSTIGNLLAQRLGQAIHIEVDELRHFADCLTLEQAIPFALGDAARLTNDWVDRGFQVIVSWPIEKADYQCFVAATAASGAPLHAFTLLPSQQIALSDRGQRRLGAGDAARIREMYATMYAPGQAVGLVVDNSEQSPAETVQRILDHVQRQPTRAAEEVAAGSLGELRISLTDVPAPADKAFVRQRIREFNDSVSEDHRRGRRAGKQPLAGFLHNATGELVGGLIADTYWGWLDIDHLWVAEGNRGQGYGRALMARVEAAAVTRGCRQAQVRTWDFQARGFYEVLGYRVVGRLEDFPPGRTLFWLGKRLAPAET